MSNDARTKRLTLLVMVIVVATMTGFGVWFVGRVERTRLLEAGARAPLLPTPTLNELPDQVEREPLVASAPSALPDGVPLETPKNEPASKLEKVLPRVSGRVLDLHGLPVADQDVHGEDQPTHIVARSRSDGTFTTDPVPSAFVLVADSAHFVCLRGVRLPTADGVILVVAPTISVAGFVVDETGEVIEGASVGMPEASAALAHFPEPLDRTYPIESVATTSDASGRFTYERAVAGFGMKLKASRDGYEDGAVEVPEVARADLRIVLTKKKSIEHTLPGVVVHQDGTPATNARVHLADVESATDAQGAFVLRLPNFVQGAEALVAVESGYQAAFVPNFGLVVQKSKLALEPVRLVLGSNPLSITGRVVDAKGAPSNGWTVGLVNATEARVGYAPMVTVESMSAGPTPALVTGQDGTFALEGLLDREYTLFAYHSETLVRVETRSLPAGTRNFDIVVPADACFANVSGRVTAPDGTPVADAIVSIGLVTARSDSAMMWINSKSTKTKADGSFEIEGVPRLYAHFDVGGDHVIPRQFPLADLDATKPVVLTIERRCHFRVEGLPSDEETRWLAVQDRNGKELSIASFQAGGWSSTNRQTVSKDRTRVFAVSETAVELVMYFPYDTVIAKRALRLTPGEVTVVKW